MGLAVLISGALPFTGAGIAMINQSAQTLTESKQENVQMIKNSQIPLTIEEYVKKAFSDTPILISVAKCESEFKQFDEKGNVIRGIANRADVGIMQINEFYNADDAAKLGMNIYELDGNIKFAKWLYGKYGTKPWTASKPCWGKAITSNSDSLAGVVSKELAMK